MDARFRGHAGILVCHSERSEESRDAPCQGRCTAQYARCVPTPLTGFFGSALSRSAQNDRRGGSRCAGQDKDEGGWADGRLEGAGGDGG